MKNQELHHLSEKTGWVNDLMSIVYYFGQRYKILLKIEKIKG
jgi:hypothetical protein